METSKVLQEAVNAIEKKYGKGVVQTFDETNIERVECTSTGSLNLDRAMGGGYAKGRIVEIYGPESSGKSTLALHAVAEVQKNGGVAAYIDAEHAFDRYYAENLGVQMGKDQWLFVQPDNGEQAMEIVEILVRTNKVDMIIVDSVAALTPRAEIDGEMGDSKMGLHARMMSQAMRKLVAIVHKSGTTLIFINQLRDKIGVVFGNPETTTGGNALKFYASQRLDIRRIGQNKEGDEIVSNHVKVKVAKNKVAPPHKVAEFDIVFGIGIDKIAELLDVAVDLGIVNKSGSWYSYDETKLGQGAAGVRNLMRDNPELLEELTMVVHAKING